MDRRERVEAQLAASEVSTLMSLCDAAAVPFGRWLDCPPIARPFLLLAAERLARRIAADRDLSLTAARVAAAVQLDVEPDTLKSWRRRWRGAVYTGGRDKGDKTHPTPRAGAA